MPFLAILRHDLRTLAGTWLVRLWLFAAAVLTLVLVMSNWDRFQTAPLIASALFPYLVFPWFLVVMVLGISPVSGSRAEGLADGLLSRPVTRYEYLLATWSSRVLVVLGAYLIVMVPAIWLMSRWERPVPEDSVTLYGICGAMGVVGLVLTFQVSLAFLLGTVLRRSVVTMVVLLFLWYPVNGVLNGFQLEEFSPLSLSQAIPTLLRQPWSETEEEEEQSKDITKDEMEEAARAMNQAVSMLFGGTSGPAGAQGDAQQFLSGFSGTEPPKKAQTHFFDREDYEDFSLTSVALAYGSFTVLAVVLAIVCFCWRDL